MQGRVTVDWNGWRPPDPGGGQGSVMAAAELVLPFNIYAVRRLGTHFLKRKIPIMAKTGTHPKSAAWLASVSEYTPHHLLL